jgi:hypothetical protein
MRAEKSSSACSEAVAALVAAAQDAGDEASWAERFRDGFDRLYMELDLHPAEHAPAAVFASAADTARRVAAQCLPLGIALVMHLYPLCAFKCVPLPWWSAASLRRSRLLREVENHGLVLANAGGERDRGTAAAVTVTKTRHGLLVNGTFEYVSLAHVADVVLFPADGDGRHYFCAADTCAPTLRIGPARFGGSMRLSDTCSLIFDNHHVPVERLLEIPTQSALQCTARYQRSWFHLLLGEAHLARIEHLYGRWNLPHPPELRANLEELAFLRRYALCLLDDAARPAAVDSLARVTAAMKLRISWLAQSTASAVRERDGAAAHELGFIRRQPTCDDKILAGLGRAFDASALEIDERQKLAS